MSNSLRSGVFFGMASGVITTLGLIVGLYAGTRALVPVIGGILVIAVSDSMSDAFGIHLAEEAREDSRDADVWRATFATLVSKLVMALTFVLPLLLLPLGAAIYLDLVWGVIVLTALSYFIASTQGRSALPIIAEHLLIGFVVVVLSWLAGMGVNRAFG